MAETSWIFQANPNIYDLRAALAAGIRRLRWAVRQRKDEIHVGDPVYLWISGSDGGLVAAGQVTSEPHEVSESTEERQFHADPAADTTELRAEILIDRLIEPALSRAELQAEPALANMLLFRMAQGTNQKLSTTEAACLEQLIAPLPSEDEIIRRFHEQRTVFQSRERGHLYRIASVDDSGCTVERLSADIRTA